MLAGDYFPCKEILLRHSHSVDEPQPKPLHRKGREGRKGKPKSKIHRRGTREKQRPQENWLLEFARRKHDFKALNF